MNTIEYKIKEPVMGPLINSGSFFKSNTAATGIPKLETGPQKCVVNTYLKFCLLKIFLNDMVVNLLKQRTENSRFLGPRHRGDVQKTSCWVQANGVIRWVRSIEHEA